jgi:hypothetical protein
MVNLRYFVFTSSAPSLLAWLAGMVRRVVYTPGLLWNYPSPVGELSLSSSDVVAGLVGSWHCFSSSDGGELWWIMGVAGQLDGGGERARISCSSICTWSGAGLLALLGLGVGLLGPVVGEAMSIVQ